MGRGNGQMIADSKSVLYGRVTARPRKDLSRIETEPSGVIKHYNQFGDLYKLFVPRGGPYHISSVQLPKALELETAIDMTIYLNGGKMHRYDGPAVEYSTGYKEYWFEGQKHSDDGPAVVIPNCLQEYWRHGKKHRDHGPAVLGIDGLLEYWSRGQLHREDGPAIIRADGSKEWYQEGELHHEEGPAISWANGEQEWHLHGKRRTEKQWEKERPAWSIRS